MKGKINILQYIGMIIYVVISIIDRFIVDIADYIYISMMIIAIILLVIGFIKNKKSNI